MQIKHGNTYNSFTVEDRASWRSCATSSDSMSERVYISIHIQINFFLTQKSQYKKNVVHCTNARGRLKHYSTKLYART